MYKHSLHNCIYKKAKDNQIDLAGNDAKFYTRLVANASSLETLHKEVYGHHIGWVESFDKLIDLIIHAYVSRPELFRYRDDKKAETGQWFLDNKLAGMSLYVDRFCGSLKKLQNKLPYFQDLGVNLLHVMPLFDSPMEESDGGYAVRDFRKVNKRFGSLSDLKTLQKSMMEKDMYLMLDIVLNHTSNQHEWALKAKAGSKYYQDFFYFYSDREMPDLFDSTMPEVFPESAPGNFTYINELDKWVMTVFHQYQWDLNYTNPIVLEKMLENIFFYANLGVDILRIDAPAFIWKQPGTTSQNLETAHTLLRLIKLAVNIATPGMALLGEAIVAPQYIMKYFGEGSYTAKECDIAYNATQMALQWDMLATGDTRIMLAAQSVLQKKPIGTTWLTYTRCHDDIGLGYDDWMISAAGYNPFSHRNFIKNYYTGNFPGSPASGALFAENPKTSDARISGTLASLCGLETAILKKHSEEEEMAVKRILLMQAFSFFLGGIPMLFYGDEIASINDYDFKNDIAKSYDNRWMHRPVYQWNGEHIKQLSNHNSAAFKVFSGIKKLLKIRGQISVIADFSNVEWCAPHNIHVAAYLRRRNENAFWGIFNFSDKDAWLTWYAFRQHGLNPKQLFDHWQNCYHQVGSDNEYIIIPPYSFLLLEPAAE
jgi:amylosucrase